MGCVSTRKKHQGIACVSGAPHPPTLRVGYFPVPGKCKRKNAGPEGPALWIGTPAVVYCKVVTPRRLRAQADSSLPCTSGRSLP